MTPQLPVKFRDLFYRRKLIFVRLTEDRRTLVIKKNYLDRIIHVPIVSVKS